MRRASRTTAAGSRSARPVGVLVVSLMGRSSPPGVRAPMDRGPNLLRGTCTLGRMSANPNTAAGEAEEVGGGYSVLRRPAPGPMFGWVKVASYVELALFGALIVVWLAPGLHGPTSILGLAHGLGFIALAALIWAAVLRHEAPYTLLAATLTPVGPVGSVIAIHYIERGQPLTRGVKKDGAGPRRGSRGPPHVKNPLGPNPLLGCNYPAPRGENGAGKSPASRVRTTRRGGRVVVGGAGPREAGGPHGPRHRQRVGSQGGMPTRSVPGGGTGRGRVFEVRLPPAGVRPS